MNRLYAGSVGQDPGPTTFSRDSGKPERPWPEPPSVFQYL